MANNISKYCQLTDFVLLEYEFNKDGVTTNLVSGGITPMLANTSLDTKQYFNKGSQGVQNNDLKMNSVPINSSRTNWYINSDDEASYYEYFDSSTAISQNNYTHDKIKVHIVSGYNFDDISGFLLQIRAKDASNNMVDLSNFTWINQVSGNDVLKFSSNALYLGNRFYDKYIEFLVPSIENLGGDESPEIGQALLIQALSDVYITYSTITEIEDNQYIVNEFIDVQVPVTSQADNFNAFIAESTAGDFIEYYATWKNQIIGDYMSDIESGRIRLYTSNNPNDNYQDFTDQYGVNTAKWVVMHEIYIYENIGNSQLLTQKFIFTQEDNFSIPNYFRPVIKNPDIASSFSIDYICRLTNRMDGSQIIRKASFSSTDPKKYGTYFERINIDNYIPYNVFNKLPEEKPNIVVKSKPRQTKFVKVFYDTTNILLNQDNNVLPQGTGPLFLRKTDNVYKFKFEKLNVNVEGGQRENVDLSGIYSYALEFVLDDDSIISIAPSFSTNMNIVHGELEFKIYTEQSQKLLKQQNNSYSIIIKNPDGTKYTFYEGLYYKYSDLDQVMIQYQGFFDVQNLNEKIANLELENQELRDENVALKTGE